MEETVTSNSYRDEQRKLSQESLRIALFTLMKTQQFQEISISTLCKRAGISRMAFYRNYDSKEAVLVDHFDHYVRRFMNY